MKYILAFALLIPVCAWSQNTCKLHRETDPYTKETKVSTGFIELAGGSVTIDADSKEVDFFFTISGNKCYDEQTTIVFVFEGSKSKTTTHNNGSMNCEGFFHLIYKNNGSYSNSLLNKMLKQKITTISFIGNDKKETKIEFSEPDQRTFMELANCLIEEAKTLVK